MKFESSPEILTEILRSSIGPEGQDYAKSAYREGISNVNTLQLLTYDPKGAGVFLATGPYYASRNEIIFYPVDFNQSPWLYKEKIPLAPVIEESAHLLNSVGASWEELTQQWNSLAQKYPDEAFIWDYAGRIDFNMGRMKDWAIKIKRAYQLAPDLPEHKLMAASVAYYEHITNVKLGEQPVSKESTQQTIANLLNNIVPEDFDSINYQGLRLALLQWANQDKDPESATIHAESLKQLYKENKPLRAWVNYYMKRLNHM